MAKKVVATLQSGEGRNFLQVYQDGAVPRNPEHTFSRRRWFTMITSKISLRNNHSFLRHRRAFLIKGSFFYFLMLISKTMGIFSKDKKQDLERGLEKTKESVFRKLSRAVIGKSRVDGEVLDNLEEVLITSDVGVETTLRIIERIENRVCREKYLNTSELNSILREEIVPCSKRTTQASNLHSQSHFPASPM